MMQCSRTGCTQDVRFMDEESKTGWCSWHADRYLLIVAGRNRGYNRLYKDEHSPHLIGCGVRSWRGMVIHGKDEWIQAAWLALTAEQRLYALNVMHKQESEVKA